MGSEQSLESAGSGAGGSMNAAALMATAQAFSHVKKQNAKAVSRKKFLFEECFHPGIDLSVAQSLVCPTSHGVPIPNGRFLLITKPQEDMFSVAGSVTLLGGTNQTFYLVVSYEDEAEKFDLIQENNKFTFNGHMTHCTSMTDLLTYLQAPRKEVDWDAHLDTVIPPGAKSGSKKERPKTWASESSLRVIATPAGPPAREELNPTPRATPNQFSGPIRLSNNSQPEMAKHGRSIPNPWSVLKHHVHNNRATIHEMWAEGANGAHRNASWVPENQFGRNIPDPVAELGKHIVGKAPKIKAAAEANNLNMNAKGVKKGEHGFTDHISVAEKTLNPKIKAKMRRRSQGHEAGSLNNASGVAAGEHGNTKHDPEKEVGKHIRGRRNSITDDIMSGDVHNATHVLPNQFGRNLPDPMAEVGEHIQGKKAMVHKGLKTGKLNNATWVAEGEHGNTRHDPVGELGDVIVEKVRRQSVGHNLGENNNATWVTAGKHGFMTNADAQKDISDEAQQQEVKREQEEEQEKKVNKRQTRLAAEKRQSDERDRKLAEESMARLERMRAAKRMAKGNEEKARQAAAMEVQRELDVETPIQWTFAKRGSLNEEVTGFDGLVTPIPNGFMTPVPAGFDT